MEKLDLNNLMAIAINPGDGEEIVKWFQSKGIDTGKCKGINCIKDSSAPIYGTFEGRFTNYPIDAIKNSTEDDDGVHIYTIAELKALDEPEFPFMAMVSDKPIDEKCVGIPRTVIAKNPNRNSEYRWVTIEDDRDAAAVIWKFMKKLPDVDPEKFGECKKLHEIVNNKIMELQEDKIENLISCYKKILGS